MEQPWKKFHGKCISSHVNLNLGLLNWFLHLAIMISYFHTKRPKNNTSTFSTCAPDQQSKPSHHHLQNNPSEAPHLKLNSPFRSQPFSKPMSCGIPDDLRALVNHKKNREKQRMSWDQNQKALTIIWIISVMLVDGWNPVNSPVEVGSFSPLFTEFYTSYGLQDFWTINSS